VTPKVVPERMLVPLLESASLEEDRELCRVWALLLANMARNPEGVLPAFVSILGELSPTEARLLASWATGSADVKLLSNNYHTNQQSLAVVGDVSELRLILTNLERLLLIAPSLHASEFDKHGDDTFLMMYVRLTRFGARFAWRAARRPNRESFTDAAPRLTLTGQ
jgi:Abortive infection alpha